MHGERELGAEELHSVHLDLFGGRFDFKFYQSGQENRKSGLHVFHKCNGVATRLLIKNIISSEVSCPQIVSADETPLFPDALRIGWFGYNGAKVHDTVDLRHTVDDDARPVDLFEK